MTDIKALEEGILAGDRFIISKAITLVESSRPDDSFSAEHLLDNLEKAEGVGFRLGITGPPGVGKSSFIERIGNIITEEGLKLAVLAIDPSSPSSGGSILGDKTRMAQLSANPNVFIRPSPSKGSMGGINYKTDQVISIFEAAGYDVILVETVGVGQAETSLRSIVDYFLLLASPGGGDELQGIKRGIMELIDGVAITKKDLFSDEKIASAVNSFKQTFHFINSQTSKSPVIIACSAVSGDGIVSLWHSLFSEFKELHGSGVISKRRSENRVRYFEMLIELGFRQFIQENDELKKFISKMSEDIIAGNIAPRKAATKFFDKLKYKL